MFSFTRSRSWLRIKIPGAGAAPKQAGSETLPVIMSLRGVLSKLLGNLTRGRIVEQAGVQSQLPASQLLLLRQQCLCHSPRTKVGQYGGAR